MGKPNSRIRNLYDRLETVGEINISFNQFKLYYDDYDYRKRVFEKVKKYNWPEFQFNSVEGMSSIISTKHDDYLHRRDLELMVEHNHDHDFANYMWREQGDESFKPKDYWVSHWPEYISHYGSDFFDFYGSLFTGEMDDYISRQPEWRASHPKAVAKTNLENEKGKLKYRLNNPADAVSQADDNVFTFDDYIKNNQVNGSYIGTTSEWISRISPDDADYNEISKKYLELTGEQKTNKELHDQFIKDEQLEYDRERILAIDNLDAGGVSDLFGVEVEDIFLIHVRDGDKKWLDKHMEQYDPTSEDFRKKQEIISTWDRHESSKKHDGEIVMEMNELMYDIQSLQIRSDKSPLITLSGDNIIEQKKKQLRRLYTLYPEMAKTAMTMWPSFQKTMGIDPMMVDRVGVPTLQQEISNLAKEHNYNPVPSFLTSKPNVSQNRKWNSKHYTDQQINNYLEREFVKYSRAFSKEDIDTLFSGKAANSDLYDVMNGLDRQEFENFVRTNPQAQAKLNLWLNKTSWDTETNSFKADLRDTMLAKYMEFGYDRDGDGYIRRHELQDIVQGEIFGMYLEHKYKKINYDNSVYQAYNIPQIFARINGHSEIANRLESKFLANKEILDIFEAAAEDGVVTKDEIPTGYSIDDYRRIVEEQNKLVEDYNRVVEDLSDELTPENRKLMSNYIDFAEEYSRFETMVDKSWNIHHWGERRKEIRDNQYRNDKYYEVFGEIGIQETVESLWNVGMEFGGGIWQLVNLITHKLGTHDADNATIMSMTIDAAVDDLKFTLDSKGLLGDDGSLNWNKLLPSLGTTIGDMIMMMRGGKFVYKGLLSGARGVKMLDNAYTAGKLYKLGKKVTPFSAKGGRKIASGVGTIMGSVPVILPQQLEMALSQISEDFTVEDALDYAIYSTILESSVEVLNPDFKFAKISPSRFRKGKGKGIDVDAVKKVVLNKLKKEKLRGFLSAVKQVPPELLEEFIQSLLSGSINHAYNKGYGTNFHIQDPGEFKETALLTTLSVLAMRAGSGKMFKADNSSLYDFMLDNDINLDSFLEEQIKLYQKTKGKEGIDGVNAARMSSAFNDYAVMKADVLKMFEMEDGELYILKDQYTALVDLVKRKRAQQQKIKDNPNDLSLQEELNEIDNKINNFKNDALTNSKRKEKQKIDKEIEKNEQKLKRKGKQKLGNKAKQEVKKELDKLRKKSDDLDAEIGNYYIDGKVYKTPEEFLNKIRANLYNGNNRKNLGLNIDVRGDFKTLQKAYQQMGKYAPKGWAAKIVMTQQQADKINTFIAGRTEQQIRKELELEQTKDLKDQDKKKIRDLSKAVDYFELKSANYEIGTAGFLVQKPSYEALDRARLKMNAEYLKRRGKQIGGKVRTDETTEAFNERMDKLSNEQSKLAMEAALNEDIKDPQVRQKLYDKYMNKAAEFAMAKINNGFFDPDTKTFYVNMEVALENGAISVGSHELLHGILYKTLMDSKGFVTDAGIKMIDEFLEIVGKKNKAWLDEAMKPYIAELEARYGEKIYNSKGEIYKKYKKEFYDEYLTKFHDGIKEGAIEYEESIWRRIGNLFRRFFRKEANIDADWKSGRDVYNFIKTYTEDSRKGKLRDEFIQIGVESLKSIKTDTGRRVKKSLTQKAEAVEFTETDKGDLFASTNDELDISLQGYGLDEPFDRDNPDHVKLWNSISKEEKLFIGYAIGQHWKKFAGSKLDSSGQSNKFNYSDFRDQLIDVLATGVETGQNALPSLVANWNPSKRKLTSHIYGELAKRIPHVAQLPQFSELGRIAEDQDPDDVSVVEDATKQYKLYTRLGNLAAQHNENIRKRTKKMTKEEVESYNYKSLKDLDIKTTAEMFGIDTAKLDPTSPKFDANLRMDSKKGTNELLAAQMFINNNAKELFDSLPKHHTTKLVKGKEVPDKATGVPKVILEAFYTKGERGSNNLTPWTLNKDITLDQFRNEFGVINRKSFRGDRNISARVLKLAMMTGKLMTNQAIREQLIEDGYVGPALATISDGKGRLMFHMSDSKKTNRVQLQIGKIDSSLNIPDDELMTNANKAVFWREFKNISDISFLETSLESVELALRENYAEYPTILKNAKPLAASLFEAVKRISPKVKTKGTKRGEKIIQKILETNATALKNVINFTNSSVSMKAAFKNTKLKRQFRAVDKIYIDGQYKEFVVKNNDITGFIRYIEQMKGHSTSSPTRAAAYGYYKNSKPRHVEFFTKEMLKPIQAKYGKEVDGKWVPDLTYDTDANGAITKVYHVSQISKDNPSGRILAKDKNGIKPGGDGYIETNIDLSFSENSTKAIKQDYVKNKDGSYKFPEKIKKRKKDEKETQEFLNSYVEFWSNKYKKGEITEVHLAMVQASLLSSMRTALGRAATLKYVSDNYQDLSKDDLRYEHMQPRVAVIISMFNEHINKNGIKDISKFLENYNIAVIPTTMDKVITDAKLGSSLYKGQTLDMPAWIRYFNDLTRGDKRLRPLVNIDTGTTLKISDLHVKSSEILAQSAMEIKKNELLDIAIKRSRIITSEKGITILDFDDTLATTESLVRYTTPDGKIGTLNAEQYASTYEDLLGKGYTFDFSDFNKVVKGKLAPLFKKALKLQNKFGPKNMFVLTARPPASQQAIYDFLKANGLNIPLKNITGLGNSTSEAKALWVAEKVGEGYNDFYFADDALQNVQAVKNMLDQFDVKSKVQQARLKFHKSMDKEFNIILENASGIDAETRFDEVEARLAGKGKGRFKSIISHSAQDFEGLLYNFVGKGKKGEKEMEFLKKAVIDPFARGYNELNTARQNTAESYKALLKEYPDIKKKLREKVSGTNFTFDQAIRIYLWNKAGYDVPGISKGNIKLLSKAVKDNPSIQEFADTLALVSKHKNGFPKPGEHWIAENISSDLFSDGAVGNVRQEFLEEWIHNKNIIFSKENLNKIEAIYGSKFREALEDVLYRMETGRNRPVGGGRLMNMYMNWMNNSVGAIMFFNIRSAVLQTISATNYINWTDNNPLKAAAAFANQKQFWKDFVYIFNSDMLKQRRAGLRYNVNEAELAAAVAGSDNKAKAAIAWLLKKGFTPTQIADSFAISSGGASFYRNRVKSLMKADPELTLKQAEEQAWLDFQEVTEKAQQSSRPDLISQQQANPLGRLILAFANTPMQYMRIMNKAARDLYNGRGDAKTHISKILYYGVIQSFIFNALQKALFAVIGSGDEEELDEKETSILYGMLDGWLVGIGYGGRGVSTVINTIREFNEQRAKDLDESWTTRSDHAYTLLAALSFSPPLSSKVRKIYQAIQTEKFNREVMLRRGFTLDNPGWSIVGNVIEGAFNIPLGRLHNKMLNIENAMDSNHEWWERAALILGWNTWDLGIKDPDIEELKITLKEEKKEEKEKKKIEKKKKKEEEKEIDNKLTEQSYEEDQKREKKKNPKSKQRCSGIKSNGERCSVEVGRKGGKCTIHEKVEQRSDGKKVQCSKMKKISKNKTERCKIETSNKSGLCYYHD